MTTNPTIQLTKNKCLMYIPFHELLNEYNPSPPYIQRSLKQERVNELYEVLLDYYDEYGYVHDLNSIHIGKYQSEYFILDGQHRYNAYKRFFENEDSIFTKETDKNFSVLVTMYNCLEEGEYEKIFDDLNTNYISTTPLVLTEDEKKKKKVLVEFFDTNYKKYVESESKSPRFPNADRDEIINDLLKTYPTKKSSEIINEFYKMNEMIGKDLEIRLPEKYERIKNKIAGIKKYEGKELFYVYKIHFEKESEKKHKRKSVPDAVRNTLWISVFGHNMIGQCYCCNGEVHFIQNYEASHVVSVAHGGSDNIHNLRICCKSCNRSMGVKNLEDFKKEKFGHVAEV